ALTEAIAVETMHQNEGAGGLSDLLEEARDRRGWFDHETGGTVAADAPSPHRLVVGGQIELDEAGTAFPDHLLRLSLQVLVEAPSRHGADTLASRPDELARGEPAVGRAAHPHHRGQREVQSPVEPLLRGVEDPLEFCAHLRCSVSPPSHCGSCPGTGNTAVRFPVVPAGGPGRLPAAAVATTPGSGRDRAAIGVDSSPAAIIRWARPGACRSTTSAVASGVTS